MNQHHWAVVIIDAQKGFTDSTGSFARCFGAKELANIRITLMKLQSFLRSLPPEIYTLFVRSEYKAGQFTDNDLRHPLAYLCVPDVNCDCEWAEGVIPYESSLVATKQTTNAIFSDSYQKCIKDLVEHSVENFMFCGFTLTTCVQQTVISTRHWLKQNRLVNYVALDLTGARLSNYQRRGKQPSLVEQVKRQLKHHGIKIITSDYVIQPRFLASFILRLTLF